MAEAHEAPEADPTPKSKPLRWGPERRIHVRPDFKRVYEYGKRTRGRGMTLFRLSRDSSGESGLPWRLGITVTRQSGGAVVRNRLRRIIREFFRLHQWSLPEGWDLVVNAAPEMRKMSSTEIGEELRKILSRTGSDIGGPK